jgi:hypothetical protein
VFDHFRDAPPDLARPRLAGSEKTRSITMMTLFTIYELEQLSDNQLENLHYILYRLLMTTDANSADRRNILATLENIEIVLGQKPIRQIGYNRV